MRSKTSFKSLSNEQLLKRYNIGLDNIRGFEDDFEK